MSTPHERAVMAVCKVLNKAVLELQVLEHQAHESSTMILAKGTADAIARLAKQVES